jgi:hypothetical protein
VRRVLRAVLGPLPEEPEEKTEREERVLRRAMAYREGRRYQKLRGCEEEEGGRRRKCQHRCVGTKREREYLRIRQREKPKMGDGRREEETMSARRFLERRK